MFYRVDLFQIWMVVRPSSGLIGWSGVNKIKGCWLFCMDESSDRKSLLSDTDRVSVGVDILGVGGGVFFLFLFTSLYIG